MPRGLLVKRDLQRSLSPILKMSAVEDDDGDEIEVGEEGEEEETPPSSSVDTSFSDGDGGGEQHVQVKAPRPLGTAACPLAPAPGGALLPGTMESFYSRLATLSALYSQVGYNYLNPFLRYQQQHEGHERLGGSGHVNLANGLVAIAALNQACSPPPPPPPPPLPQMSPNASPLKRRRDEPNHNNNNIDPVLKRPKMSLNSPSKRLTTTKQASARILSNAQIISFDAAWSLVLPII